MTEALYSFFQSRYSQILAPYKQRFTDNIIDLLLFLFLLLLIRPMIEIISHRFNLKSIRRRLDDIKFILFGHLWHSIAVVSIWKICRSMSYFSTWFLDSYVILRLLLWVLVLNFMSLGRKLWTFIKIFLLDLTVKEIHHIVSYIRSLVRNQFWSTFFINLRILINAKMSIYRYFSEEVRTICRNEIFFLFFLLSFLSRSGFMFCCFVI